MAEHFVGDLQRKNLRITLHENTNEIQNKAQIKAT